MSSTMVCPKCGDHRSAIYDSRAFKRGKYVMRKRQCRICGYKWTTFEISQREFAEMGGYITKDAWLK